MRSDRLSAFWGRDIVLEACILLPWGHGDEAHQQVHYPLIFAQTHYSAEWCVVPLSPPFTPPL